MARAGVAAHSSSPATEVAYDVEYVEYELVGAPVGPGWYCWWLVDNDGTLQGPGIWRPPWEFLLCR